MPDLILSEKELAQPLIEEVESVFGEKLVFGEASNEALYATCAGIIKSGASHEEICMWFLQLHYGVLSDNVALFPPRKGELKLTYEE